jgi:hypothetical protein
MGYTYRMKYLLVLYVGLIFYKVGYTQCDIENHAFLPGEKITYNVVYNWGFIWVNAGIVDFSVYAKQYKGKSVYHLDSQGTSLKSYDWMFKVRDRFQSYADRENLNPIWFERNTYEGGYKAYENYVFARDKSKIYSATETSNRSYKRDTLALKPCVFDVVTAVYYCRNLDFEKYVINQKIPLKLIIDNEIHEVYLRYLGKEVIETRDKKTYRCIKFTAMLVDGTIFKGGEDMIIWVTDDRNRIPVLVEAKILIGSVKALLNDTRNLRYPVSSLVK